MLLWISVLRYLEFSRATYGIVLTLQRAAPRVAVFLAGALPVFFAFTAFAVAYFGDTVAAFANPRIACVSLFAILNGDIIRDSFIHLMVEFPVAGQVFMYTFVSFHIYVALNVLIALVEEAFFQSSAESASILARQQTLMHTNPSHEPEILRSVSEGGVVARSVYTWAGRALDDVDVLRDTPRGDLDALQSGDGGTLNAWRVALRLKEWDEVMRSGAVSDAATVAASVTAASAAAASEPPKHRHIQ
jgi:hypothetical protein